MSSFPPALPEPAADPANTGTPLLRRAPLRWAVRLVVVVLAAAASVLLIAWLALHWAILPHIQQWREPIEMRASRALGVPVRIGQIEVRSSGWVPSLELRDVVVLDAEKRPALSLPRIFAAVSPRSLLSLELRFEQLLIDGAQLELRRDPQGRFFVAGLDVSGDYSGDGNAIADWFFKQREFVIRGGSLRWTDEQRQAPPLVLGDVQLVIRNGLLQHNIHLDATPPPEWGDRFSVSARFTQPLLARRGDWRRWSGSAYASLPRADLHALRQHVALPFELSEGVGALRGWFELKDGQPQAATVDVALRSVALRLAQTVDALAFEQVEGRLVAQRNAEGGVLEVQRLSFLTGDGVRWPQGDMKLAWRQREGEAASGGEFSAQRLDVGQMAQVASRIPLGEALRRLLDELQPQGVITELAAKWDGPLDAPAHYRVKGLLSGLSLASKPSAEPKGVGRPGLRNATLQLSATELGGEARIGMKGGVLDLPGVFDDPLLPLDQLNAQLAWKIEPAKAGAANPAPQVSVTVKDVRFSNADAQGELSGSWRTGPGTGPGARRALPGQARTRRPADQRRGDTRLALPAARHLEGHARLHRARDPGWQAGERELSRQGRPGGLSVLQRALERGRRVPHRRQGRRRELRLRAERAGFGQHAAWIVALADADARERRIDASTAARCRSATAGRRSARSSGAACRAPSATSKATACSGSKPARTGRWPRCCSSSTTRRWAAGSATRSTPAARPAWPT